MAIKQSFGYFWLRDNAKDAVSYDIMSNQRELYTADIPLDIEPVSVELLSDGNAILVQWPNLETAVLYDGYELYIESKRVKSDVGGTKRVRWDAKKQAQRFSLQQLSQESPEAGASLIEALCVDGFALIDECAPSQQSVVEIANCLGYVRETIFGGVWEFEADGNMADTAYSSKALRPHTDGSYSFDAPGVQILLCVENDAEGGKSVLVDGHHVAQQIKQDHPDQYLDLTLIDVEGVYKGDGAELRAMRPVFREDAAGELVQVTYNNYDRSSYLHPKQEMDRLYPALQTVDRYLNNPSNQWTHQLSVGQALVFDNWRLLHGRTAFEGNRKMTGAYTNREDLESRIRLQSLS